MIRTPDLATTFDELIKGYYGGKGAKPILTVEQVVAGYYGRPYQRAGVPEPAKHEAAVTLSLGHDQGEILPQMGRHAAGYAFQTSVARTDCDEYVVGGCAPDAPPAQPSAPAAHAQAPSIAAVPPAATAPALAPAAAPASPATSPAASAGPAPRAPASAPAPAKPAATDGLSRDRSVEDEYRLDVLDPLATASPTPAAAMSEPAPAPSDGQTTSRGGGSGSATLEEDQLAADMRAILGGQKVFDAATGEMRDRSQLAAAQSQRAREMEVIDGTAADIPERPMRDAPNEQAIFDRIAQSMEYANSFDLGTVELDNRFADFDQVADARDRVNDARLAGQAKIDEVRSQAPKKVGTSEFIEDLDAIREQREAEADLHSMPASYMSSVADWTQDPDRDATCAPSALKLALSESVEDFSRPFYDTGEHVLAGGDLYPNRLRLGRQPGVAFSYGELLGMADLYESVDQMLQADPAELNRVKTLVDRSTQFYKTNKSTPSLDVSNTEWDTATGGRYLRLAEDNFDHFSPNTVLTDAVAQAANHRATNQGSWRAAHMRAIGEAQRFFAGNADPAAVPEWALTVNAFGDHFLTDAFASGHLINKEVMFAYFKANFFNGNSLKPAANDFFKRVAEKAFVGDVAKKFSALETADYPVCAWGLCIKWHPNINSASRFQALLVKAAEQQPDKVANVAVKALHDKLNKDGIEVTNGAGDGTWTLTGDGYLNPKTLGIMKKAVQASVDNVLDRKVPAGIRDFTPYYDKVWRFVPKMTPASQTKFTGLVHEYTNPSSTVLSTAAAEIVGKQVDSLIKVLLSEGKLKPA
jgi:hypothetical protein